MTQADHQSSSVALRLPADFPAPPVSSFLRAGEVVPISTSLVEALGGAGETFLFSGLGCALAILLHRYTRQDTVGLAIAHGRGLLPVLVDLEETNAAGEVKAQVNVCLEGGEPVDECAFAHLLVDHTGDAIEMNDLGDTTGCECVFHLERTEDDLHVRVDYDSELFLPETVTGFAQQLLALAEAVAQTPALPVSALSMLRPEEAMAIVDQGRSTFASAEVARTVVEWFESQAEQSPKSVALVYPGLPTEDGPGERAELTYAALNERANQLAHHLQQLGVVPETLVGLYLERTPDLVVGILGILKAGGAYLPVDLAYPRERVAFMLEDAGIQVLLTHQDLIPQLPDVTGQVVPLDSAWPAIATQPTTNLERPPELDSLAYVIYTSGSTGTPKGAMVTHRNLARLFLSTESWFNFNAQDVWTLFHSVAFDFSVWEMWGALLYGGRLVVIPYLTSRSPERFYELLCTEGVTVLNQTPSAFRQLSRLEEDRDEAGDLALRYVVFGGEALEVQSLAAWFARHGDAQPQLVNMYGITETTVHVTYRPLSKQDLTDEAGSVIGVPIPDLRLYLLDDAMQPVPAGVPAEVYVGGAGVGRGYLNRKELSDERFVANPFETGERLYRSGDLARREAGGDLQYVGRVDHQVKVRGFRIELGEIEAVLGRHPAVSESLVLARDEDSGRTLVAYVVGQGEAPTPQVLREYLAAHLPDYMLPTAFVVLDAMPLTPHGKIDRKALPAPEQSHPVSEDGYVAPRTALEQAIASVYAEVLKMDKVGLHDNFFELGGDSLRVGQVIGKLRDVLDRPLEMVRLFEHPTVGALAAFLEPAEEGDDAMAHARSRAERKRAGLARRKRLVKDRTP